MLKRKGFKISIIIGAILLLLITMPEICVDGARNGLLLWFETILPTLFPFFVVTRMIIELDLCPQFLRPYYPIFVGLLSGYPTGALTLNEMILRGQISRKRGQILLVLCNNASPVFLISYVACSALHINNQKYLIWFCVILASTITTIFLCLFRKKEPSNCLCVDQPMPYKQPPTMSLLEMLESTIMKSFEILVLIGGYVIIFSLFANVFMSLPLSDSIAVFSAGILEITTGIHLISKDIGVFQSNIKSAVAAALCGFGGISALLQTQSAIKDSGLSISKYTLHKIICALLSGLICYVLLTYFL